MLITYYSVTRMSWYVSVSQNIITSDTYRLTFRKYSENISLVPESQHPLTQNYSFLRSVLEVIQSYHHI